MLVAHLVAGRSAVVALVQRQLRQLSVAVLSVALAVLFLAELAPVLRLVFQRVVARRVLSLIHI